MCGNAKVIDRFAVMIIFVSLEGKLKIPGKGHIPFQSKVVTGVTQSEVYAILI